MKKIVMLLCVCVCTLMVSAQTTIVLKHQKDTTISLKLKPYKYSHKKCDTVDMDLSLLYDQTTETIMAVIICKKQSSYNLLWIPPKDNGLYLTNSGKFQKDFKNKYNVKVSLSTHLKKQIKELKLNELYPITYRNCEFFGYNVPDTVRCKAGGSKEKSSKLQNEMFDVNVLNALNMRLSMNYKVINKANTIDIRFFGFVPVKNKSKSVYSKSLELEYIADGPLINIKLQRDPCLEEMDAIKEVNILIDSLKIEFNKLEIAKTERRKRECDQIKTKVSAADKILNIDGLHANSLCTNLLSAVGEYHFWVEKITKYKDDLTCQLNPKEINGAVRKINDLVNKYIKDKKTDVEEIDNIISNINNKINAYGANCKNNTNVQSAINSFNGVVNLYHKTVKK